MIAEKFTIMASCLGLAGIIYGLLSRRYETPDSDTKLDQIADLLRNLAVAPTNDTDTEHSIITRLEEIERRMETVQADVLRNLKKNAQRERRIRESEGLDFEDEDVDVSPELLEAGMQAMNNGPPTPETAKSDEAVLQAALAQKRRQ